MRPSRAEIPSAIWRPSKYRLALNAGKGYYNITAEVDDGLGNKLGTGHDEILAVDWQSDVVGGTGAVVSGDLHNSWPSPPIRSMPT